MRKQTAMGIAVAAWAACIGAAGASLAGAIPPVLAGAVLVAAFPAATLFLFLWWSAGPGEPDIPFLGY